MTELPISSYDIVEYNAEHDTDDKTTAFAKKNWHTFYLKTLIHMHY